MFAALLFALVASSLGAKPEFQTPFEKTSVQAGREFFFVCKAEGERPIAYKWYNKNEDEITDDGKLPVYAVGFGNDSGLYFKNVSSEQEGWYTCTASNAHGLSSKVFFLRVPPPSDGNDTEIDQGNGTSRFLDAKVLMRTASSVTFLITTIGPVEYIEAKYREGNRSSNTTTIRLKPVPGMNHEIGNLLSGGSYIFQFRTVPPESNDWSREYNVTLPGVPDLPDAPQITLQNIGDRSVKLMWLNREGDILNGIDRYQIKYVSLELVKPSGIIWDGIIWKPRNCSVMFQVPTCVGSPYTILELERKIFYDIEVRAHNEAGYSEPWRMSFYLP